MRRFKNHAKGVSMLVLALGLPGCKVVDHALEFLGFIQPVKKEKAPEEVRDEKALVNPTPDPANVAASIARENSELLSEIFRVVFNQDAVEDKIDFGGLLASLNQGASFEGIYRGIIAGSRYRALESKSQAASPAELRVFATELADLQSLMRNPTEFSLTDSKKAPEIVFPDGSVPVVSSPSSQEIKKKVDKPERVQELIRIFIGASSFTLKRVLGEEALRKFDEDKDDSGGIAQWYAKLAVRLGTGKVDFGLELRNRPDFDFHFKFAQQIARDRVKWEVLNRYHRTLNAAALSR
jgi:hypothetical protein